MDAALAALLTHLVNVYHLVRSEDVDGQPLESYPDRWHPDLANYPAMIVQDGATLARSPVGAVIGSTAIMYCQEADIREHDRVHFKEHVLYVNGTPQRTYDVASAAPLTAYVIEAGLIGQRADPA